MSTKATFLDIIIRNQGPVEESVRRRLMRAQLAESINRAAVLTLNFEDAVPIREHPIFVPRVEFFVVMGWKDDFAWRGPFIVREVSPSYRKTGMVQVRAQDRSVMMNRINESFAHHGPMSEVVSKLAEKYALGFFVDKQGEELFDEEASLHQMAETDMAFLSRVCRKYGYSWHIEDGVLRFQRDEAFDRTDLIYSWGVNDQSLAEYTPTFKVWNPNPSTSGVKGGAKKKGGVDIEKNAVFQAVEKVVDTVSNFFEENAADEGEGEVTTGEAATEPKGTYSISGEDGSLEFNYYAPAAGSDEAPEVDDDTGGAASPESAEKAAQGLKKKRAKSAKIGNGSMKPKVGNIHLRPRRKVFVLCAADQDSAEFVLDEVTHTVDRSSFTTTCRMSRRKVGRAKNAAAKQEEVSKNNNDGQGGQDTGNTTTDVVLEQLAQLDPENGVLKSVTKLVRKAAGESGTQQPAKGS